jgi:hypothetical protein
MHVRLTWRHRKADRGCFPEEIPIPLPPLREGFVARCVCQFRDPAAIESGSESGGSFGAQTRFV